jgi:protein-L-isoaspartate O-methyltransferase
MRNPGKGSVSDGYGEPVATESGLRAQVCRRPPSLSDVAGVAVLLAERKPGRSRDGLGFWLPRGQSVTMARKSQGGRATVEWEWLAVAVWNACAHVVPLRLRRRIVAWLPAGFLTPATLEKSGFTFNRSWFERLYAGSGDDPWGFETAEREHAKYAEILTACGNGPFSHVLEMGCSSGVFTEMLAPRCARLIAVDISSIAVDRARARLACFGHVRCERCTLPADMPEGPFALVVCSDLLYYWPMEALVRAIPMLEKILAPGGRIVCLHWRGKPTAAYSGGDEVHDVLVARLGGLARVESREVLDSRLDVFEKTLRA